MDETSYDMIQKRKLDVNGTCEHQFKMIGAISNTGVFECEKCGKRKSSTI